MWAAALAALGTLAWILSIANVAGASSGGISGYSGNPAIGGGATCSQCHSGGVAPTVTLDGPTSLSSGQTADYTLTIVGGNAGGLGVSVTGGELGAGVDTRIADGEIVQTSTKPTTDGEVTWMFSWTAPNSGGEVTMYGAGNAVNGDFGLGGDAVDTDSLTISVTAVNAPPVADVGGPYVDDPTAFIVFDGSGSSDPDGTIASWEWDFGDGGTASGKTLFHSYVEDGVYTVTLTVTDDAGATDTATTTATIGNVSNLPPTADAGGPYDGTTGEQIAFDGSGSSDPEGETITYAWDFGDGNTATDREPSHSYSAAGSFTVTLTVTDESALSGTDTATVTVAAAPTTTVTTAAPSVSGVFSSMCAGCHGANGQGGAGGPSLQVSTKSTSELQSIIANGSGGMPGYSASLDSSVVSGLASFTKAMQSSSATTSPPPTGGEDIYGARCAGCHGGNGEGASGPSLQTSTLSTSAINTIVTDGFGGMPGYADKLDVDQISAVSAYTAGLQDAEATTDDSEGTGAAAYASQCAGCHGADGEGGFGPSLQDLSMSATEIGDVIANGYGGMRGFSDSLTPEQISELAAYSVSLQAGATGGEGSMLYATNCAACHGASGEGGIGPALAGTSLSAGDIGSAIQGGTGAMHSLASSLSPDDVAAVADYILGLQADTGDSGDQGAADATAAIYSSMCAGCHGAAGEGASAPALAGTALDTAGLITIITNGQNGMPGYAGQLSATEIENLAGLVLALGQGHGDVSDTTTNAPATTRAVVTAEPEDSDDDEGTAARTLGIILLALVLGSGTYLGFASRAVRRE